MNEAAYIPEPADANETSSCIITYLQKNYLIHLYFNSLCNVKSLDLHFHCHLLALTYQMCCKVFSDQYVILLILPQNA